MHLLGLCNSSPQCCSDGECTYLSSLGIDGACGAAAHGLLIRFLGEAGADKYLLRCVTLWLAQRYFRLRLQTPAGRLHFP